MVDFIAFDGNGCYSTYDALELNKNNLTCSCGTHVITKKRKYSMYKKI
jgi:hypothetical protein